MGTTADKLAKLAETMADLKAALAEKGQTVGDVFSEYPAAVRAIESGAGKCVLTNTYNTEIAVIRNGEQLITSDYMVEVDKNSYVCVYSSITDAQYFGMSFSGDIEEAFNISISGKAGARFCVTFYIFGDATITISRSGGGGGGDN